MPDLPLGPSDSASHYEVWEEHPEGQRLVATFDDLSEAWRAAKPGLGSVFNRPAEEWEDPEDATW